MGTSKRASTAVEPPAPAVVPREATDTRVRRQPPYAVILENDDVHSFAYVVAGLQKVFHYGRAKAFRLMFEAHLKGRAIVWTGSLELAELKRDQLRGLGPDVWAGKAVDFPLGVVIEPLPGD